MDLSDTSRQEYQLLLCTWSSWHSESFHWTGELSMGCIPTLNFFFGNKLITDKSLSKPHKHALLNVN